MVSTRIVAGLVAIIPLYSLATLAAFFSARTITVYVNGQSAGLYDHYFNTFLIPTDLLWSFAQAIVMAISRSEEHTSELQSLMRISYAVFCLKKKTVQRH